MTNIEALAGLLADLYMQLRQLQEQLRVAAERDQANQELIADLTANLHKQKD